LRFIQIKKEHKNEFYEIQTGVTFFSKVAE